MSTALTIFLLTITAHALFKIYQLKQIIKKQDIQLKQVNTEIEGHYKVLVENSPDLIVRYDNNGRRLYVNQTYQRVTGMPIESLIGKTITDNSVLKGSDAQVLMKNIFIVFETGTETSYEVKFTVNNRDYYYDYHCIPEKDENNKVQSILAVGREITAYKKLEIKLQNLATTDELTGISNRRSFMDRMAIELASVKRYKVSSSLLMIDLDHFKGINDLYGHAGGDATLKFFSELIQKNLRTTDIFGRLGGEEFAIVLHLTPFEAVLNLSERLRFLVKSSMLNFQGSEINFTISIGVTNLHESDREISEVIQRADKALYKAKNSGRNKVISQPKTGFNELG